MKPTPEQIRAYVLTVKAIADTIKESGRAPAGVMYSALMGRMSLETFNGMIEKLVGAGLVRKENGSELVWIGPA